MNMKIHAIRLMALAVLMLPCAEGGKPSDSCTSKPLVWTLYKTNPETGQASALYGDGGYDTAVYTAGVDRVAASTTCFRTPYDQDGFLDLSNARGRAISYDFVGRMLKWTSGTSAPEWTDDAVPAKGFIKVRGMMYSNNCFGAPCTFKTWMLTDFPMGSAKYSLKMLGAGIDTYIAFSEDNMDSSLSVVEVKYQKDDSSGKETWTVCPVPVSGKAVAELRPFGVKENLGQFDMPFYFVIQTK